jgi:hypothetical protein
MAVLGTAMALCSGFAVYFVNSSPDVRLNKQRRQTLMRQ